jgi:glucuronoarabinoxylan endo-1,4-beta-xylanase
VYLVAFKGEETVIVVVNLNTSSKDQTFTFNNDSVAHVKRYTTSETKKLRFDGILGLVGNSFTTSLEGRSITTFVSTRTNTGAKLVDAQIPERYRLEQNYPNPFNPSTVIRFSLPSVGRSRQGGLVSLKVYDVLGREAATLVNEELVAGNHYLKWDASVYQTVSISIAWP